MTSDTLRGIMIDAGRAPSGPQTEQAKRLIEARLRAGFEHAKTAADRFGWVYETYTQHEKGNRRIKWSVAKKYAEAFGVPIGWLMLEPGVVLNGGAEAAATDTTSNDIADSLATSRRLMVEAARQAIEFALAGLPTPADLPEDRLQTFAELATQLVLARQARKLRLRPGSRAPRESEARKA